MSTSTYNIIRYQRACICTDNVSSTEKCHNYVKYLRREKRLILCITKFNFDILSIPTFMIIIVKANGPDSVVETSLKLLVLITYIVVFILVCQIKLHQLYKLKEFLKDIFINVKILQKIYDHINSPMMMHYLCMY